MDKKSVMERAFDLANSGNVRSLEELQDELKREGYTGLELSQLAGTFLKEQLRQAIERARTASR